MRECGTGDGDSRKEGRAGVDKIVVTTAPSSLFLYTSPPLLPCVVSAAEGSGEGRGRIPGLVGVCRT